MKKRHGVNNFGEGHLDGGYNLNNSNKINKIINNDRYYVNDFDDFDMNDFDGNNNDGENEVNNFILFYFFELNIHSLALYC